MPRILVVGPSWIGDTVLAQPLFRLLHERHDPLDLDVLAPPWTLPLLERMPEVRRVIVNPVGHGELKPASQRSVARELSGAGYDRAVVLPNSFKSALIPWLAGIPRRTGYLGEWRWILLNDARRVDPERHPQLAQRYAALALDRAGVLTAALPAPRLAVEPERQHRTLERLGIDAGSLAVAFCPGAEYGPAKRWPTRHFAVLADHVAALGGITWLVGSAGDAATGAEIARLAPAAVRNLCGRTNLGEAIEVLDAARIVVSNDSGLMHVAAALGKPLVALYGSSSPAYTPPATPDARILKLELPCSPCFERTCPLGHFKCMNDLAPALAMAEVGAMLARARPRSGSPETMEKKPERH